MTATSAGKTRFIILSGIKWGLSIWVVFMLSGALYELVFGNILFTWRRLTFALFYMIFCFGWGCILGTFIWKRIGPKH
jgi:hypothetical protein